MLELRFSHRARLLLPFLPLSRFRTGQVDRHAAFADGHDRPMNFLHSQTHDISNAAGFATLTRGPSTRSVMPGNASVQAGRAQQRSCTGWRPACAADPSPMLAYSRSRSPPHSGMGISQPDSWAGTYAANACLRFALRSVDPDALVQEVWRRRALMDDVDEDSEVDDITPTVIMSPAVD